MNGERTFNRLVLLAVFTAGFITGCVLLTLVTVARATAPVAPGPVVTPTTYGPPPDGWADR